MKTRWIYVYTNYRCTLHKYTVLLNLNHAHYTTHVPIESTPFLIKMYHSTQFTHMSSFWRKYSSKITHQLTDTDKSLTKTNKSLQPILKLQTHSLLLAHEMFIFHFLYHRFVTSCEEMMVMLCLGPLLTPCHCHWWGEDTCNRFWSGFWLPWVWITLPPCPALPSVHSTLGVRTHCTASPTHKYGY